MTDWKPQEKQSELDLAPLIFPKDMLNLNAKYRLDSRFVNFNAQDLPLHCFCFHHQVPANNYGSRISGYLHWRERKAWKRRWFVLTERVLYIYAASEDVVALKSIPVLGWKVEVEKAEVFS